MPAKMPIFFYLPSCANPLQNEPGREKGMRLNATLNRNPLNKPLSSPVTGQALRA